MIVHGQPFGPGTGHILMDGVHCWGNESSVLQCQHSGWGNHNCDHSKDVSINCTSHKSMAFIWYSLFILNLGQLYIFVKFVQYYLNLSFLCLLSITPLGIISINRKNCHYQYTCIVIALKGSNLCWKFCRHFYTYCWRPFTLWG